jgi:hypothetical protein
MTRFLKPAAAGLLALSLLAAPAFAGPKRDAVDAAGESAEWLFIQTAGAAAFDGTKLTLQSFDPVVVMFSDRPSRVAATIPADYLLTMWAEGSDSFESLPPNAGITLMADGKLVTATAELSNPQIDGETFSYDVKVIEGELPASAVTVSIFIDQFCASCAANGF